MPQDQAWNAVLGTAPEKACRLLLINGSRRSPLFATRTLILVYSVDHYQKQLCPLCQWPVVSAHGRPLKVPAVGTFVAAYRQFFMAANTFALILLSLPWMFNSPPPERDR